MPKASIHLDFIRSLANSGASADLAVSDHLLTVAGNGKEYATRERMIGEAESVRNAAQAVLDFCVGKKSLDPVPESETLTMLKRIAEKVSRANAIQHSGGAIEAEDWSELYQLKNEAHAVIAKAEKAMSTPAFDALVAYEAECVGRDAENAMRTTLEEILHSEPVDAADVDEWIAGTKRSVARVLARFPEAAVSPPPAIVPEENAASLPSEDSVPDAAPAPDAFSSEGKALAEAAARAYLSWNGDGDRDLPCVVPPMRAALRAVGVLRSAPAPKKS
jgi:hypothetical protein